MFWSLSFVALLLALLGLAAQLSETYQGDYVYKTAFVRMFDLSGESSIPTWFSSVTMLFCSVILSMIALASKRSGERYTLHWGLLSAILLGMSVDEVAQFHESFNKIGSLLGTEGFLYYGWVIPGGVFVVAVALAYLKFLFDLPAKTRRLFIFAGAVFVGGALGMEMVGARAAQLYGETSPGFFLPVTVEEFMEMMGVIVFCYALLSYAASHLKEIHLSIQDQSPGAMK